MRCVDSRIMRITARLTAECGCCVAHVLHASVLRQHHLGVTRCHAYYDTAAQYGAAPYITTRLAK